MDLALGWIGDIIRSLLAVFPHAVLVHSTHGGVKFRNGHTAVALRCNNGLFRTGLHLYWPLFSVVEVGPIVRQTNKLPIQHLRTADGHTVGCCGVVIYEVDDVVAFRTMTWDQDQTINDYAEIAIRDVVCCSKMDELSTGGRELDRKFTRLLRRRVKPFGVKIIRMAIRDFAPEKLHGLMMPHDQSPFKTQRV